MKKVIPIIIFFFVCFCVNAQNTFQKVYTLPAGADGETFGSTVLSDGSCLFTGILDDGATKVFLTKTNCMGQVVWSKSYQASGTWNNISQRIIPLKHGGYCLAAAIGTFGAYNIMVMKLDANGNNIWQKVMMGSGDDMVNAVVETKTGDIVIAGNTSSFGADAGSGSYCDVYIAKLDSNGNYLWGKAIGNHNTIDQAYDIVETIDSGYAATGRYIEQGTFYSFLLKLNKTGNVQFFKAYGDTNQHTFGWGLTACASGGYAITGSTTIMKPNYQAYADEFIIRTNALGDTIWTRTYHGTNPDQSEGASSIVELPNGFAIAVWTMSYPTIGFVPNKHVVLRTDLQGNMTMVRSYNNGYSHYTYLCKHPNNQGFLVSGFTTQFSSATFKPLLIRTDNNFESGCNQTNLLSQTVMEHPPFKVRIPIYSMASGGSLVTTNISNNLTWSDTTLCANIIDSCSANPCSVSASSNSPVCSGQNLNLSALPAGGTNYAWSGPNGFSSTQEFPTIIGVTPAASGTYTVTGTYTGGCTASATTTVTVNSATASAASNSPVCVGQSLNLTSLPAGATAYNWTGPNSFNSAQQNPSITSVTAAASGTYTVTVTQSNGCTASSQVNATVNPNPTVTATAVPPVICSGDTSTLTGGGANSYLWFPGSIPGSGLIVNPSVTSVYTVIGYSTASCTGSTSVTVNISLPNVTVAANPNPVCAGSPTTLTGNGAFVYNWNNGLGAGNPKTAYPAVSGTYEVTGTDVYGCTASASVYVTAATSLPAIVNIAADPAVTICTGTSVTFLVTPTNGGTPAYQWMLNGTAIPGATDSSYTSAALANGDVIACAMTSSFSCATGNPDTSNLITMIVDVPLDATINAAGPFCSSDAAFTLTAANPGGIWSGSGISDSIAGTFDPAVANIGANIINYSISEVCSSSDTVTIMVYNQADATIDPAGPFCADHPAVMLTAANPGGIWNGAGITDSVNGNFNPADAGNGTHIINYVIGGTCGDSDTVLITVFAALTVSVDLQNESCIGKNDGSIDLTVGGGNAPYIYSWSNGSPAEDLSDLVPGVYIVIVTDSNNCALTKEYEILASDVACEIPPIVLYLPNIFTPNGDGVNDVLFVRGSGIEEVSLAIYDRWGECVFSMADLSVGWDGTFHGKEMDSGVYIYYLKAKFVNDETVKQKGSVTLSR